MVTQDLINMWFTPHQINPEHGPRYEEVRIAAYNFANVLLAMTNPGPDQDAAFALLRESVDMADHSIAYDGKS